ncbi:MAG: Gx transporter family protein [Lachnospiraceae bacterium]|nr:Gx transporter family protein [Lachnospiraceae bacterium]
MQLQNNNNKKTPAGIVAQSGVLIALALVFSYVEHLIPIPTPVPGIKIGLANLVSLSGLFFLNPVQVFVILVARIMLAGLMFGNLSTIIYSLAGGIVSFAVMYLFKRLKLFSAPGISMLGGVFHNLAQLSVACIVLSSKSLLMYLPILIIAGTVSGLLIGTVTELTIKSVKKIYYS